MASWSMDHGGGGGGGDRGAPDPLHALGFRYPPPAPTPPPPACPPRAKPVLLRGPAPAADWGKAESVQQQFQLLNYEGCMAMVMVAAVL